MPLQFTTPKTVTIYDPSRAYNGYTLWAPHGLREVWLTDMLGNFIHRWRVQELIGCYAQLLPTGNIIVGNRKSDSPVFDMPSSGGELLEMDWDGNVVWRHEDLINHHDFVRMDNGNTLISIWKPIPDAIAGKIKGGTPGTERKGEILGDCLQEISPEGKVVWEWNSYDHMDPDTDIICPLCSRFTWSYINSMFVLPDGDILVNFRVANTVAIIEKRTGDVKWRWGADQIGHQHNATAIDNGNILVFDNGLHNHSRVISPSHSRVIEVNPRTDQIEWEYTDKDAMSFYSSICGSAQRLPNGNTLICESTRGRFFEVTMDKQIVWEFFSPLYMHNFRSEFFGECTNLVYRAYRYGSDYEGLQGRNLEPGRFEWVLQKKGEPDSTGDIEMQGQDMEKAVKQRLELLGY